MLKIFSAICHFLLNYPFFPSRNDLCKTNDCVNFFLLQWLKMDAFNIAHWHFWPNLLIYCHHLQIWPFLAALTFYNYFNQSQNSTPSPKSKQGSGSINLFCQWQFLLNLVGFWLPFSLNQQFVIIFVHKMSKIKVKSIYHE